MTEIRPPAPVPSGPEAATGSLSRPVTHAVPAPSDLPTLTVALLGCGVVGSQVARLLTEQADDLALRVGARLELAGIAVRRFGHPRAAGIDRALLTTDAHALVTRPDIDIVVEVIGGIEPARPLLLAALKLGKPVVTANKALLAEHGAEIYAAAREYGADLYYEASVAGAIPLLRPLRESLVGDTVHRVLGIVNGTTNYILDRMDSSGADFAESLEEAQALGYAEADPTADVEGFDAAAKAAILASLAFHTQVTAADVHREGITEVTAADIGSARALGRVVKLLAICERCDGGVSVRVHPAMIPRSHPLAAVSEAYNAVFVEAESAGRLRRAADHADGGDAHPLPRIARRGRQARRARAGGRGIRQARRLHRDRAPGEPGRGGTADHRDAHGAGRGPRRDRPRPRGLARRPRRSQHHARGRGGGVGP
jgi:homoserine dehydrogenase